MSLTDKRIEEILKEVEPHAVRLPLGWKLFARAIEAEATKPCVCGEPATPGVVHRTDGPCYLQEATKPQEPIGYDDIFNAIAEAASPCGEGIGVSVKAFKRAIGGEIFLSPTIPEGECGCKLVPDYDAIRDAERYRFLRDEENWVDDDPDFAIRPWETLGESSGKEFDSTIDSYMGHRKAMIQAAGVTK